eukprot:TRINITY_DN65337_c0_g1_i1.p1 TRINITY_DN65337_c0_g1~~TRINITY_DN65337_c0_g1_i1.p1  ORF type:complete len:453 (+),score=91.72 TRINITY_DN65337_c0_g1_i1:160-1518(+)
MRHCLLKTFLCFACAVAEPDLSAPFPESEHDGQAEDTVEFSLLQTSLKLSSRQLQVTNASEKEETHKRQSLVSSALETATSGNGTAPSVATLLMVSASRAMQKTTDIIAAPGACVLGLSFCVTLVFVVMLWGIMVEASHASKGKDAFAGKGAAAMAAQAPAPPLCPTIGLPRGVVNFSVPLKSLGELRAGKFPMEILGLNNSPIFHAWLPTCSQTPPGSSMFAEGSSKIGHLLQLTSPTSARQSLASIGLLHLQGRGQGMQTLAQQRAVLEHKTCAVFGPSNKRYGTMSREADKWNVFHTGDGGASRLALSMHTATGMLGFSAIAADGRQVATAVHTSSVPGGEVDLLTITVSPGSDTLLALVAMLAVVLMMSADPVSKLANVQGTMSPRMAGSLPSGFFNPFSGSAAADKSLAFEPPAGTLTSATSKGSLLPVTLASMGSMSAAKNLPPGY